MVAKKRKSSPIAGKSTRRATTRSKSTAKKVGISKKVATAKKSSRSKVVVSKKTVASKRKPAVGKKIPVTFENEEFSIKSTTRKASSKSSPANRLGRDFNEGSLRSQRVAPSSAKSTQKQGNTARNRNREWESSFENERSNQTRGSRSTGNRSIYSQNHPSDSMYNPGFIKDEVDEEVESQFGQLRNKRKENQNPGKQNPRFGGRNEKSPSSFGWNVDQEEDEEDDLELIRGKERRGSHFLSDDEDVEEEEDEERDDLEEDLDEDSGISKRNPFHKKNPRR